MTTNVQTCGAPTRDGSPCKISNALSADGRCIWHDPERKARAAELRSRGGKARAQRYIRTVEEGDTPGPLVSMQDAVRWASWTAQSAATGQLDARTAHELVAALREFRGSLEKAELEGRVKELERALKEATS